MRRDVSERIGALMVELGARLDESVSFVKVNCTDEELARYRRAVAQIMGTMLLDIMNPIYLEWPELKPPQLE